MQRRYGFLFLISAVILFLLMMNINNISFGSSRTETIKTNIKYLLTSDSLEPNDSSLTDAKDTSGPKVSDNQDKSLKLDTPIQNGESNQYLVHDQVKQPTNQQTISLLMKTIQEKLTQIDSLISEKKTKIEQIQSELHLGTDNFEETKEELTKEELNKIDLLIIKQDIIIDDIQLNESRQGKNNLDTIKKELIQEKKVRLNNQKEELKKLKSSTNIQTYSSKESKPRDNRNNFRSDEYNQKIKRIQKYQINKLKLIKQHIQLAQIAFTEKINEFQNQKELMKLKELEINQKIIYEENKIQGIGIKKNQITDFSNNLQTVERLIIIHPPQTQETNQKIEQLKISITRKENKLTIHKQNKDKLELELKDIQNQIKQNNEEEEKFRQKEIQKLQLRKTKLKLKQIKRNAQLQQLEQEKNQIIK
ncbi:hypothetical protein ['Camptotheca acuminata' phytoplasma]|uniref:hypothetical protein n=1 Tax='Camptotheca acuminata' phytoplasma TaxID=3239192 RepID=UPI00351A2086